MRAVEDSTLIKMTAIVSLCIIEAVNLIIWKIDGALLVTIASLIAGIAGYEIGKTKKGD